MTREEQWLGAIAGMDGVTPPSMPVWHYEQMLAAIYDAVVGASPAREFPERSWHLDEFLWAVYCAVAGLDDPGIPAPTCRIEEFWRGIYLKAMNDEDAAVPTPVWRIEEFLAEVFNNLTTAELKTVTGTMLHVLDALAKPAEELLVSLSPIQDLHGYDSPWPAGGGKNKFNVDALVDTTDITVSNGSITVTGNSKNSTKKLSDVADLVVGETYTLTASTTGNENLIYLYGTGANISWTFGASKTVTQEMLDALVFFYGGAGVTSTITDMMIRLSSVTDATFAPYSNICPISGRTGLTVYRTGKNLCGGTSSGTSSGLTFQRDSSDGGFAISGTSTGNYPQNRMWNVGKHFSIGTTLTISTNTAGTVPSGAKLYAILYERDSESGADVASHSTRNGSNTFTISHPYQYVNIVAEGNGITYSGVKLYTMLELGSTATTYEPYAGSTYAVGWTTEAGTVYHGTVDVVTGVLTVTHARTNLSTSWYWYVGNTQPTGLTVVSTTNFPAHKGNVAICSHYNNSSTPYVVNLNIGEFIISDGGNSGYFCFKGESGGTADEFKAIITAQETAGTPIQVCYELATPLTYQLTAQEVEMLLGENYLWESSGADLSLTYYADGNVNALDALNLMLGNRYVNDHTPEDVSDREALDILLGR